MLDKRTIAWLPPLLEELKAYVRNVLGLDLDVEAREHARGMPTFMRDLYAIVPAHILGRRCTLMVRRPDTAVTPAATEKHHTLLRKQLGPDPIILVTRAITSHDRHRLIARRIPFIVPGNQMYVPELAVHLQEHFRTDARERSPNLTPAAQLIVLASLLGEEPADRSQGSMAKRFGYSFMTMSRAFDELRGHGLADIEISGRYSVLTMRYVGKDLWQLALPLLRSPVRKRRTVAQPRADVEALVAGETALAAMTEMSEPAMDVYAVAAAQWPGLAARHRLDRAPGWDEAAVEIETWSYDPRALSNGRVVDPLSLWLSLGDARDERIQLAKDELLKKAGL